MDAIPVVAAIIPTHNRREALLRCLAAVAAQESVTCRAVVVCDGCADGTQAAVRAQFPDTLLVEGDGSLWWSGAVNAGIAAARGLGAGCYCLLNDDTHPEPGMLAALLLDAPLRDRLRRAAHDRVSAHFSIERLRQAHHDLYRMLVTCPDPTRGYQR